MTGEFSHHFYTTKHYGENQPLNHRQEKPQLYTLYTTSDMVIQIDCQSSLSLQLSYLEAHGCKYPASWLYLCGPEFLHNLRRDSVLQTSGSECMQSLCLSLSIYNQYLFPLKGKSIFINSFSADSFCFQRSGIIPFFNLVQC